MKNLLNEKMRGLLFLLFVLFIVSCQENDVFEIETSIQEDENFIDVDIAKSIASLIELPIESNNNKAGKVATTFKDIKNSEVIFDKDGKPSYYIINYRGGGFIIISADERVNPIQAFSTTSEFIFNAKKYPGGLVAWMIETDEKIHQTRKLNMPQTKEVQQTWEICAIQQTLQRIDDGNDCSGGDVGDGGGGCQDTYKQIGPLLKTAWQQNDGYNLLIEPLDCGRPPTGCVATAMAQVMKYHGHPATYNWMEMENAAPSYETARLMRDVADEIDTDFGCTESGAFLEAVIPALNNKFGYQSASLSYFDHSIVEQQLKWNRPVLLSGYQSRERDCFFCGYDYTNGHTWVCDGSRNIFYCDSGAGYLYLHMNWGWGPWGGGNGFYAFNGWTPGTKNYQYEKRMIYNIAKRI